MLLEFKSAYASIDGNMKHPIYLDCNASTHPDPLVVEAMLPWLGASHANPHSGHLAGQLAANAVDTAIQAIARLIGASPSDIVITSGATESNNLALQGILAQSPGRSRLLHSAVEHKAVLEVGEYLRKLGVSVHIIPANAHGCIQIEAVEQMFNGGRFGVDLVSVMHANNEIGTIQPIKEIADIVRLGNGMLHVDASQSAGRLRIDVHEMGIDLLSFSSHKMYGPQGIGALYVSPRVRRSMRPLFFGGGQQNGLRPGTLPVFLIAGFGKACEIAADRMTRDAQHTEGLADLFCRKLTELGVTFEVFDCGEPSLPGLRSIRFSGADAHDLVMRVSAKLSISSGSACTWGAIQHSHVLKATGLSDDEAREFVRIGFGRYSTASEASEAASLLADAIRSMRRQGLVHSRA